ncbi:type II secretion system protein [Coraliomargarita sp. W4R53]
MKTSITHSRFAPAFTLIELLVVIAIIGILAAITIPAIGMARAKAVLAKDVSNLRQIGQAIQLYTTSHKGNYPTMISGAGSGWTPPFWTDQIEEFLPPKSNKIDGHHDVFNTDSVESNHYIAGYGANSFIINLHEQDEDGKPATISSLTVEELTNTILVANSFKKLQDDELQAVFYINGAAVTSNPLTESSPRPYPIHPNDTFAAVFCDGHTEVITIDDYTKNSKKLFGEQPW